MLAGLRRDTPFQGPFVSTPANKGSGPIVEACDQRTNKSQDISRKIEQPPTATLVSTDRANDCPSWSVCFVNFESASHNDQAGVHIWLLAGAP